MGDERSLVLSEGKVGDRLRILGLGGSGARGRMLGMGLAPGMIVEVMSRATPGAIVVAVNHQRLGIGVEMARQIEVRLLDLEGASLAEASLEGASLEAASLVASRAAKKEQQETDIAAAVRLRDLPVGTQARVVGYEKRPIAYRRKLLAMGLTKGTIFTVTRRAPLGDPVEMKVRGFSLSLRKDEADALLVVALSGEAN